METNGAVVLEIWELIVEHLPSAKREEVANKVVKIFSDYGVEQADFESVKGEDSHLDAAIDNIYEMADVDDYDYELEDDDADD